MTNTEFARLAHALALTKAEGDAMRGFNADTTAKCVECGKTIKGDKPRLCFSCAVNTPDFVRGGYRKYIGKGL